MKPQITTTFRVEVNRGSRYFDDPIQAFEYFDDFRLDDTYPVEIFLRITETKKKTIIVTERLLTYHIPRYYEKKTLVPKCKQYLDNVPPASITHGDYLLHNEFIAGGIKND